VDHRFRFSRRRLEIEPDGQVHAMAARDPLAPKTSDGRVRVYGCSPGCLLISLAVSLLLTILLNVLIRLF
jgi:hypothetical protein